MRKYLLLGLLLSFLFQFEADAQVNETFTLEFKDKAMKEAISDIEAESNYRFYYKDEWLDSLQVSLNVQNEPIEGLLDKLFQQTPINYFIEDLSIYLTYKVRIVSQPAIYTLIDPSKQSEDTQTGLIFSKEYLNSDVTRQEEEKFVFEVGSRKEFKQGQNSNLAGYIKDRQTGDPVAGAFIYTEDLKNAATTDDSGFYTLELPNGRNRLLIQLVGKKPTQRNIIIYSDGRMDVSLDEDIIALEEVTISGSRQQNVMSTNMGMTRLDIEGTKNVPLVFGERDIMKVATTVPGVQTVGEGAAGYNVRGGKSDQNLIILDYMPVYNANHFFGFFSVFNSDALDDLVLHKSSIPARFGGRLSSVFELSSADPDRTKWEAVGGVSPVTSRLTVNIPVIKDKAALSLSGRTTYSNYILRQIDNARFNENEISFYDLIARYDHQIDDNNRIKASAYISKDRLRLPSDTLFSFSDFSYQNSAASVQWERSVSDNILLKNIFVSSSYAYELNYSQSERNAFLQSFKINENSLRSEALYFPDESLEVLGGLEIKRYDISPGSQSPLGAESVVRETVVEQENGWESSLYVSADKEFSDNFSASAGLRYSTFAKTGAGTSYTYADNAPINRSTVTGSTEYEAGDLRAFYNGLEPRLSFRYSVGEYASFKGGYARTVQYLHTLTNTASASPTDIWIASNEYIAPQTANQFSLGYYLDRPEKKIETSIEAYYKGFNNLVDFKTGEDFLLNEQVETAVLQGPGRGYGVELSLRKSGDLNGWINYTYSRTFLQLDGEFPEEIINRGEFYPTNFDKPHTFNLVANYKLTRRFSFSFNLNYSTGRPVTFPVSAYTFKGTEYVNYSDRNAYRIPNYFRMDAGFNIEAGHRIKSLVHSYWSFSIYNMTGRDNPFSVFFDIRDGQINGYQLIIFGSAIPTISYNFRI